MSSFYGGQAGKPFLISEMFENKSELVSDLQMRWSSSIMPGEYVMISYGSYTNFEEGQLTQYQKNYNSDYETYGKSYNATLWEKIYYEPTEEDLEDMISDGITTNNDSSLSYITDEKGVTYLLSGVETIFYSRDYGLGYKLIAAIGGSLPEIHVKKPTVVLGPLEEPNVEINNDDINNPELQFYLPRATKFFFGNELGDNPNIAIGNNVHTTTGLMGGEMALGDYYININTGYVFLLSNVQGDDLTFTYKACFQPPAPESIYEVSNSYYQDEEGIWHPNYAKIDFSKIANGWQAIISTPQLPNFTIGTTQFVGPLEKGYIEGQIAGANEYQYTFHIPRGSQFFTGADVEGNTSQAIVNNSDLGDIYINTNLESDWNGHVYKKNTEGIWEDQGSIKGTIGDALKIKSTYTITANQVANDTVNDVGNYLTQQGESLNNDELIVVNYINSNNQDTAYWYYQLNNNWYRVRITGGLNNILKDSYTPNGDSGYIYNTEYINSLIVSQNDINVNPDRNTYNITTINSLLNKVQIFWKDF